MENYVISKEYNLNKNILLKRYYQQAERRGKACA